MSSGPCRRATVPRCVDLHRPDRRDGAKPLFLTSCRTATSSWMDGGVAEKDYTQPRLDQLLNRLTERPRVPVVVPCAPLSSPHADLWGFVQRRLVARALHRARRHVIRGHQAARSPPSATGSSKPNAVSAEQDSRRLDRPGGALGPMPRAAWAARAVRACRACRARRYRNLQAAAASDPSIRLRGCVDEPLGEGSRQASLSARTRTAVVHVARRRLEIVGSRPCREMSSARHSLPVTGPCRRWPFTAVMGGQATIGRDRRRGSTGDIVSVIFGA